MKNGPDDGLLKEAERAVTAMLLAEADVAAEATHAETPIYLRDVIARLAAALRASQAPARPEQDGKAEDSRRLDFIERTQWTLRGDVWGGELGAAPGFVCHGIPYNEPLMIYPTARAAIDAAMSAALPTGGGERNDG